MVRRTRSIGAVLLLTVLAAVPPVAAPPAESPTRDFVHSMLRGVGARPTDCHADVLAQVRERSMEAVCARFEGSFERFEIRWGLQVIQAEGALSNDPARSEVGVEAETDWVSDGAVHDRIYRVGRQAVGVRFAAGEVLMVW